MPFGPLNTVQYNIIHYSTLHYITLHYSTLQYITVHYSTLQYITVQYSTVQYSTVQEDGVRGWITPYSTLCGVTVTGAASLVAECGTKITFLKPLYGALPKISDWIRKYVQIRHDL